MTTNEKLDAVLVTLNKAHDDFFRGHTIDADKFKYDSLTEIEIAQSITGMDEIQLILEFLVGEWLVCKKPPDNGVVYYKILWKGKVFIETGGFTEAEKSLVLEKEWKTWAENRMVYNGKKLNLLTLILSIGTVGLLLFEIYKFCFEHAIVFVCH